MKTQKWAACIGRAGLLAGLCALPVLALEGLARAQMLMLHEAPQNASQTSQAVNNAMDEHKAAKARQAAARAEAYRNSAEGQAVQRRVEQEEANRKQAEALKKAAERAAACAREKARNGGSANFVFIFSHCD